MASELEMKCAGTRFAVYRKADAQSFCATSCMAKVGLTPAILDGIESAMTEDAGDGQQVKLLFSMPGMSLTYVWFKSGLPLHRHDGDCLYCVIAGNLKVGTEALGPGDGFFVGGELPYAHIAGPLGVEVLEFRSTDSFDVCLFGKTVAFWDKTTAAIKVERETWADQRLPNAIGIRA